MPVDKFGNEVRQRSTIIQSEGGIDLSFANNTYLRLDGENDVTGNLNMDLNKIENLGEPTNPRDATNKEYVDKTKGNGIIGEVKDETATLKGNLDFKNRYRIKNLPDPIDGKDGVNRDFVDIRDKILKTEIENNYAFEFRNAEYQAKEDLNLKENRIKNLPDPADGKDAVNREYVDEKINLNSAFVFKNNSFYANGGLILRKNKLGGLREPTQDGEATTKKYVDDKVKNLFIDENDNIAFGLNVDMDGKQILGLPEPITDREPATKKYVDDLQTQNVDDKGNIKFGRNINLERNRIFSMKEPTKASEGANKKYVDDTINRRIQEEKDNFLPQDPATKNYVDEAIRGIAGGDILVSKEGVFIKENGHYRATAPLDIDNQKMENIPDPVDEKDAVNKKYVDNAAKSLILKEALIRENGGYNIADAYINMNFNNIRNVGNPKNYSDAVPRSFVDDVVKSSEEKVKKEMKHLIAANASYNGDLIKGNFQFTWGAQSINTNKEHDIYSGFVVPSSGYIKKFVVFSTGIKINGPKDKEKNDLINEIGLNKPFPVFTLVLIRQHNLNDLNVVDIGTLYFFFLSNFIYNIGEVFKFNPDIDEKTLRTVKAKDIINIRSEFDSKHISEKRFSYYSNNVYPVLEEDLHTYNASILIELDPIDD